MAEILLAATGVELVLAFGVSVVGRLPYLGALAAVFLFTGVSWTIVGMLVSGTGRITPPLTTAGFYGFGRGTQPSLSSELYISPAGAERVAKQNMQSLAEGSGFMIPAVLYGLAIFVIGLWLVA